MISRGVAMMDDQRRFAELLNRSVRRCAAADDASDVRETCDDAIERVKRIPGRNSWSDGMGGPNSARNGKTAIRRRRCAGVATPSIRRSCESFPESLAQSAAVAFSEESGGSEDLPGCSSPPRSRERLNSDCETSSRESPESGGFSQDFSRILQRERWRDDSDDGREEFASTERLQRDMGSVERSFEQELYDCMMRQWNDRKYVVDQKMLRIASAQRMAIDCQRGFPAIKDVPESDRTDVPPAPHQNGAMVVAKSSIGQVARVVASAEDLVQRKIYEKSEHVSGPDACLFVQIEHVVRDNAECEAMENRLREIGVLGPDLRKNPRPDDVFVCASGGEFHVCTADACADCEVVESRRQCWKTGRAYEVVFECIDENQYHDSSVRNDSDREDRMESGRALQVDRINSQYLACGQYVEAKLREEEPCDAKSPWNAISAGAAKRAKRALDRSGKRCDQRRLQRDGAVEDGDRAERDAMIDAALPWLRDFFAKFEGCCRAEDIFAAIRSRQRATSDAHDEGIGRQNQSQSMAIAPRDQVSGGAGKTAAPTAIDALEQCAVQTYRVAKRVMVGNSRAARQNDLERCGTYGALALKCCAMYDASRYVDQDANSMLLEIIGKANDREEEALRCGIEVPKCKDRIDRKVCEVCELYLAAGGFQIACDTRDMGFPPCVSSPCDGNPALAKCGRVVFVAPNAFLQGKLQLFKSSGAREKKFQAVDVKVDGKQLQNCQAAMKLGFKDLVRWEVVKFAHDSLVSRIDPSESARDFESRIRALHIDR